MKALDIMTTKLVTTTPDASVKEIATLLTRHRISGLPVVAPDGHLLGIISESDLLHRTETGTDAPRKWWLRIFTDSDTHARDYAKAHGLKAADIMTRKVVTIEDTAELHKAASLLEKHKRLPVMRNGRLVGIVTSGDLVRAVAEAPMPAAPPAADDDALLAQVYARVRSASWLESSFLAVNVVGGVAELDGFATSTDQRRALNVLVGETPGISRVEDRLRIGPPNRPVRVHRV